MNQTPRVSWPLRHRGRLACTRSLERRTAGCVLFVTCYLLEETRASSYSTVYIAIFFEIVQPAATSADSLTQGSGAGEG